jgi:hypothetical protein
VSALRERGPRWRHLPSHEKSHHVYRRQERRSLKGLGFKANYYDVETGAHFWISGPKRNGGDALYGGSTPVEIDEDVREEYWRVIRRQPEKATA